MEGCIIISPHFINSQSQVIDPGSKVPLVLIWPCTGKSIYVSTVHRGIQVDRYQGVECLILLSYEN